MKKKNKQVRVLSQPIIHVYKYSLMKKLKY